MSFSKAKIHRFNDDIPYAPPPGAYNPEKIDKSVGPIIHKSERFTENYKFMMHASSTESVCSIASEKGTSSTNFTTFKTPKVPNTYRTGSRTDVARRGNFSYSKALSTDFINKKSSYNKEHKMNPLKYSLHILQDELAIEKNKNQQLIAELNQLKETSSEAECFSEYLVETVTEKNNFIDLLTEKCHVLQQISIQNFESYQSYIQNMHEVLQIHYTLSLKTDSCLAELIERYEKLVAEYKQDIESFFVFLVDLQQKQSCKGFDRALLNKSSEQCNFLVETLKGTEWGQRKYEIIVQEMQKVINVLSGRVRESDKEVEKTYEVVCTLQQNNAKLSAIILNKDEELKTMRDVVDSMSRKFVMEVRDTEKSLSTLINEFQERATAEREKYAMDLNRKNSMIADLLKNKNKKELQLQEALDEIELSKCREENLRHCSDGVLRSLRDKHIRFQTQYEECCEKLRDLEQIYNLDASDAKMNLRNDSTHTPFDLVKKIVGLLVQNNVLKEDIEDRFTGVEKFEEQMSVLRELLMGCSSSDSKELAFLPHLINAVSHTFSKLVSDNDALRNDVIRLRDDFIEKCDECGQLTKLLQLSEKNVENSEKKTTELESHLAELEANLKKEQNHLVELESKNLSLKQELIFESNVKESELILENGDVPMNKREANKTTVEIELKEEQMKNEELQKRIVVLEKLVKKLIVEKKSAAKSDLKVNSKCLAQLNQDTKSKIAVLQPKRNSQPSIRKSSLLTEGKENKITRNNETFEIRKTATAEIPMNATYVVTSPKFRQ